MRFFQPRVWREMRQQGWEKRVRSRPIDHIIGPGRRSSCRSLLKVMKCDRLILLTSRKMKVLIYMTSCQDDNERGGYLMCWGYWRPQRSVETALAGGGGRGTGAVREPRPLYPYRGRYLRSRAFPNVARLTAIQVRVRIAFS